MPVAFLLLEFIQPAPSMPSPAPNTRLVSARGLSEEDKATFTKKHSCHTRQVFTNTHNKGTPLEDMMKDVPAMLSTLETLGYHVVSSTCNSIFKQRDLPEPVIRDSFVWTLVKKPEESVAE